MKTLMLILILLPCLTSVVQMAAGGKKASSTNEYIAQRISRVRQERLAAQRAGKQQAKKTSPKDETIQRQIEIIKRLQNRIRKEEKERTRERAEMQGYIDTWRSMHTYSQQQLDESNGANFNLREEVTDWQEAYEDIEEAHRGLTQRTVTALTQIAQERDQAFQQIAVLRQQNAWLAFMIRHAR